MFPRNPTGKNSVFWGNIIAKATYSKPPADTGGAGRIIPSGPDHTDATCVLTRRSRDFMTGMIFDIQRFSIHDGPGIRTTVFFKGCPLNCLWCHNPESKTIRPQLSFKPELCIGCGACFQHCPRSVHRLEAEQHRLERDRCTACGVCTETCYAEALELVGRRVDAEDVIREVLKDKPFYETSGGGMTLSGGEPLMQLDFTLSLLQRAREEHLHTAIETCGYAAWEEIEPLLPLTDLFLYDIKETNPEKHRVFTGVSNERIRENLKKLHDAGSRIVVRLPLIPGLNDRESHFQGIAELARELKRVDGFDIMPYHRLGESKLARLGLTDTGRPDCEAPTPATVDAWADRLTALGVPMLHEKQA
jgi:pyruvate formate lyase activating enzyme